VDVEPGREPAPTKDAATIMLLRDCDDGGLEVFMVRRHAKSGFMGGAFVFPGGKLDEADMDEAALSRCVGRTREDAVRALGEANDAARAIGLYVAAVRETFEEAGVLLADLDESVDLEDARQRIASGEPFSTWLAARDVRLRLDMLEPWARWVTPSVEPRRYDTRFFVAVAPSGQVAAHDRHETVDAAWMTPREALERERNGEIQLPPPTQRNLELLGAHGSTREVIAAARAASHPPYVDPVFVDDAGTWILALPGDPLHPSPARAIEGPTRFVLAEGRWWARSP
jgi:8-oxo-dGTP pyrophosphatase MutT (NUDIX family)